MAMQTRDQAAVIERALVEGDLSVLTPKERVDFYVRVCDSLGLNRYTKPFEYLRLNQKLVLYARKDATDQLRKINGVSITGLEHKQVGAIYVVTASAIDKTERRDSSIGAVPIQGLTGENLSNAMMRAETKAKRRVTLSLCGLGMLDESEIDSIPNAQVVQVDTGEEAPSAEMQVAWAEWDAVVEQANLLGLYHKDMPEDATLSKLRSWTDSLAGLIADQDEPDA